MYNTYNSNVNVGDRESCDRLIVSFVEFFCGEAREEALEDKHPHEILKLRI